MEWLRKTVAVGQRAPFPVSNGPSGEPGGETLFAVLLAHFDLHQSQGHRSCAREVLELAQRLIGDDPDLHYRWLRKWARWLESVGRREEALELLQTHLRRLRGKLNNPTRNAEVRMELGIMLDRAGRKEEAADEMLAGIYTRAPWALIGYSNDLQKAWKKDRPGMIAEVDRRKSGQTTVS